MINSAAALIVVVGLALKTKVVLVLLTVAILPVIKRWVVGAVLVVMPKVVNKWESALVALIVSMVAASK